MLEVPSPRQHCRIRVHGRLARFVAPRRRGVEFVFAFDGLPPLKDRVEAVGVPHVEVGRVVVDGEDASLATVLRGGEVLDVFPRLHQSAGDPPRFMLDVHLGRLASELRLLGIDAECPQCADDAALEAAARAGARALLSRDVALLKRRGVEGAFVYSDQPVAQAEEVVERFNLTAALAPFTRCARCNGLLDVVAAADVATRVPPRVLRTCVDFRCCRRCGQVYWPGTHVPRLRARWTRAGIHVP